MSPGARATGPVQVDAQGRRGDASGQGERTGRVDGRIRSVSGTEPTHGLDLSGCGDLD